MSTEPDYWKRDRAHVPHRHLSPGLVLLRGWLAPRNDSYHYHCANAACMLSTTDGRPYCAKHFRMSSYVKGIEVDLWLLNQAEKRAKKLARKREERKIDKKREERRIRMARRKERDEARRREAILARLVW